MGQVAGIGKKTLGEVNILRELYAVFLKLRPYQSFLVPASASNLGAACKG